MKKKIFVFTDAHILCLGAILAQDENVETVKPVAIISRNVLNSRSKISTVRS